jgi:hypothetical protein
VRRRETDGSWRLLSRKDGLAGNDIQVITDARDGGMWAAGMGGLSHVRENCGIQAWTEQDGSNLRLIVVPARATGGMRSSDVATGRERSRLRSAMKYWCPGGEHQRRSALHRLLLRGDAEPLAGTPGVLALAVLGRAIRHDVLRD